MAVKKQETTGKISLSVGDDNWKKVITYVESNKTQGSTKLMKALRTKYVIPRDVEKEINGVIS